ncbi:MAG: heme-binding protein [Alphaproteobacteria bacterium]|nr:heme-binding protein [Alphaproteobacteria bacterium]
MRQKLCLSADDVRAMVKACKAAASERGVEGTIAVVDEGGQLLYLERPDGQGPNSVEMATGKARTAAIRERPTRALEERVAERPGFLTYPNAVAVRGGVPVFYEGKCVGGIGVSGIGENDEPVAQAGADALG